jgi:hypothetical protein
MSTIVPAITMQVAKTRKVVTSDFIAFSGCVAHRRNATRRRLVKKHN